MLRPYRGVPGCSSLCQGQASFAKNCPANLCCLQHVLKDPMNSFSPEAKLCPGLNLHYFTFKSKKLQNLRKYLKSNSANLHNLRYINLLTYRLRFPNVGRVCVSREQSGVNALCSGCGSPLLAGAVSSPGQGVLVASVLKQMLSLHCLQS